MATKLKPWYQVVTPREDLRENRPLDASEFAVHLQHIQEGRAHADYMQPERFFERTFPTKSLVELCSQVVRRLSGIKVETSAVFNMATQFGGGKTHALTAIYHLARGGDAAKAWRGVSDILTKAQVATFPKAAVAVFVGTEFDALTGRGGGDGPQRKTPWGEIAWQLGGEKAFAAVKEHDEKGVAPGGDVIRQMLPEGPCVVLMDELLSYMSAARKLKLADQFYHFLQRLSEEARARDNCVVCISIPASELEMTADDQADFDRLRKVADRLGKAISMSSEGEVTEIIRRRLFEWSGMPEEGKKTVVAYATWVKEHERDLAALGGATGEDVAKVFASCYPFHPSVVSVFERKWQALARFQRTRGVLRLLALWVSRVYTEGYQQTTGDALITLGSAPLHDASFADAVFEQLGDERLRIPVNTDIAGKNDAHAVRLDNESTPEIKKGRLHQKTATIIFFESNGGQSSTKAEATEPEIKTALGEPDFSLSDVDTVLEGLASKCYYLLWDRNKYRFGLKPNLNQMLVNSRGSVKPKDVDARLKLEIESLFKAGASGVDRKYFPARSADIPDRPVLTLVVMGMDHPQGDPATKALVEEIIRTSGSAGRTFKSGLLFAVPDDTSAVKQSAQTLLAWEEIDADDEARSRIDESQAKTIKVSVDRAKRDLKETLFRAYHFVFLLDKDNTVKVENFGAITSSGGQTSNIADLFMIELGRLDVVVEGVGSSKLARYWPGVRPDWSTKDVRDAFFASPALPRLRHPDSIKRTIADGVSQGLLGYGRRKEGGGIELVTRPKESLSELNVDISDEMCILKAEDAQKLLEPPRLAKVQITPSSASAKLTEVVAFSASGTDQYGAAFPLTGLTWTTNGGVIDALGRFKPSGQPGTFTVNASSGEVSGVAPVYVADPKAQEAPKGGRADGKQLMLWSADLPPQKWTTFYTKVLAKFANQPGFKVKVSFEAPVDAGQMESRKTETKAALKDLGLDELLDIQ